MKFLFLPFMILLFSACSEMELGSTQFTTAVTPLELTVPPASNNFVVPVSGVCEDGVPVVLTGDITGSPVSLTCTGGTYSGSVTILNTNAPNTINATQFGQTQTVVVDHDTIPPVVDIGSHTNGDVVGSSAVITGSCENTAPVIVTGDISPSPTQAACSGGAYTTIVYFPAPDGPKVVDVTQEDPAGNPQTVSVVLTADTTPPAITIVAPVDGTDLAGVTHDITVACEAAGGNVTLSGPDLAVTPAPAACAGGTHTFVGVTFTTGDGVKSVIATQVDASGNSGSDNADYNFFTTAPVVAITGPAAGSVHGDDPVTLTGTCEADSGTVTVTGNVIGAPLAVACNPTGMFSIPVTLIGPDGPQTLTASQTNPVGTGSDTENVVYDGSAPAGLAISIPAPGSYVQSNIAVSGTCDPGALPAIQLMGLVGSPIAATCSGGTYGPVAAVVPGPDGVHTITAIQSDSAGNSISALSPVILDTMAPSTPVTISSHMDGDDVQATETLTGACDSSVPLIEITGPINPSPTIAVCMGNSYSVPVSFTGPDGPVAITVTQADPAGNSTTVTHNYTLDTAPPTGLALTAPTPTDVSGNPVAVTGTCDPSIPVIEIIGNTNPAPTLCVCNGAGQITSCDVTFNAPDGPQSFDVVQTDPAGNPITVSGSVTVDTMSPNLTVVTPVTTNIDDGTNGLLVTGACEDGIPIDITGDIVGAPVSAVCSGSSYSQTVHLMAPDGNTKSITVTQQDLAGNDTAITVPGLVLVTVTQVAITGPAPNTNVSSAGETIQGLCDTASGSVTLTATNLVGSPVTVPCTGDTFTAPVTFIAPDGLTTLTAAQGTVTDTLDLITDTMGPTMVVINSHVDNDLVGSADVIEGTCDPLYPTIELEGPLVGSPVTGACDSMGNFSVPVSFLGSDGDIIQVDVSQDDGSGNVATDFVVLELALDLFYTKTSVRSGSDVRQIATTPSGWEARSEFGSPWLGYDGIEVVSGYRVNTSSIVTDPNP